MPSAKETHVIDRDLQSRFRFMLANAGYSVPPGRAVCALDLARAERLLDEASRLSVAYTNVEDDHDGTIDGTYPAVGVVVGVYEAGDTTPSRQESVWGIEADVDPNGYLRVVRAELASELEDDLRQAIGDALDAREGVCTA